MVKYAVLALVIMCSGCEHDRSFHGNYITTDDIAKITVRKSSMNDVRAVLGTPFIMTKGNEWIYIYKEVDSVPFKENVIKTHKKCRISFTKDRIVDDIKITDIEDLKLKFDSQDTKLKK